MRAVVYFIINTISPEISEVGSRLIAFFTSIVQILYWFYLLDFKGKTYGKNYQYLHFILKTKKFSNCLMSYIIKLFSLQLRNMGMIYLVCNGNESLPMILHFFSIALLLMMVLMRFMRKDKRHLGDISRYLVAKRYEVN